MISKGRKLEEYIDITHIKEADIAAYYLGVTSIPCLIASPLRIDKKPSFALFSKDCVSVGYIDYSTRECGSILQLLTKLWKCSVNEAKKRILSELDKELNTKVGKGSYTKRISIKSHSNIIIQCKTREWEQYDIDYWDSFGIPLIWLRYADVYPISHKIVIKDNNKCVYKADKYAYAYVEFKEGKTTIKVYQPFNTNGFKWSNNHDKSVISLWTKIPKTGDKLCVCASLKDALTLWANTNIPSIAVQGEGYKMNKTAVNDLKSRFSKIYVCFDNDKPGLKDAEAFAKDTGFINVILPQSLGGKDISDCFKASGKNKFLEVIYSLFK